MTSQPTAVVAGKWLLMIAANAVLFGAAAAAMHGIFGFVHWHTVTSYTVIGTAMALTGWGGMLLMRSATARSFVPSGSAVALALHFALRFFAGAAGYVLGMLMAKKMSLVGFYDIPIRPIFFHGGALGFVLGIVAEYARREFRLKRFAEHFLL
jgi:hypothetical protein